MERLNIITSLNANHGAPTRVLKVFEPFDYVGRPREAPQLNFYVHMGLMRALFNTYTYSTVKIDSIDET